jgi:hypothetical protein
MASVNIVRVCIEIWNCTFLSSEDLLFAPWVGKRVIETLCVCAGVVALL